MTFTRCPRLAFCTSLCASLVALDAASKSIMIEEQPLPGALEDFSMQTDLQLAYVATLADGKISPGTQGKTRPEAALSDLLRGTELRYQYVNDETVAIGARRAQTRDESAHTEDGKPPEPILLAQVEQPSSESESDSDAPEEDTKKSNDETDDAIVDQLVEEVIVTGTRLQAGDPSANVVVFTAEDIIARGVSNLEEFFRTVPWAFSSISTQTNLVGGAGTAGDTDVVLGDEGLGVATVNLRALGSANTLVLVDGRRVASIAGYSGGNIVNLLNIPLSAIERVEIQIDGASAVYGADAIGGVVNFITRSRFTGLSVSYRQEDSAHDADRGRLSASGGLGWEKFGRGQIFVNLSRSESDAINNRKIWTSKDLTDQYGPEFDLNREAWPLEPSQPGVACKPFPNQSVSRYRYGLSCDWSDYTYYQLPPDHDGVGATVDDFMVGKTNTDVRRNFHRPDYIHPQNGVYNTTDSFTVNMSQYLLEDLRIHAKVLYSNSASSRDLLTTFVVVPVPASNAYNPFGVDIPVSYWPVHEIESGKFKRASANSEYEQRNLNVGLDWTFGTGHELNVGATRSYSNGWSLRNRISFFRYRSDPTAEEFWRRLESSDPAVALNLFGNGTAQTEWFDELLTNYTGPYFSKSEIRYFDVVLRGPLFNIWGGPVRYVVGAENRKTVFWKALDESRRGGDLRARQERDTFGTERPTTNVRAYFTELSVPIVGKRNARPGLRSLVLSLQVRRDVYERTAAQGATFEPAEFPVFHVYVPGRGWVETTRYLPGALREANLVSIRDVSNTPRIGLQYSPVDSLILRASWSRSFVPPLFGYTFGTGSPRNLTRGGYDPYHPDGRVYLRIPYVWEQYSSDVRPEYADRWALSFEWTAASIPGLRWRVDWSRVDHTDKVYDTGSLVREFPEIGFALPEIVTRDADGYATGIRYVPFNLAEKYSEIVETTVSYDFETRFGHFDSSLTYTGVLDEYFTIAEGHDRIDRVGTAYGSDRYNLTGQLTWNWRQFTANLFARHVPTYTNDRTGTCVFVVGRCEQQFEDRPALEVEAFAIFDLSLTYQFKNGLRLSGGGRNIFDTDSPTVWEDYPYDPVRWDARGRVLYLELNWEK